MENAYETEITFTKLIRQEAKFDSFKLGHAEKKVHV